MAFSSTTTPQSVQTEAPDASCCSISFEPQFGQNSDDDDDGVADDDDDDDAFSVVDDDDAAAVACDSFVGC